jgi:hypothetical protein
MSVMTDQLRLGVEGGSETVEVAFQHVYFVSGPDGVCDKGIDPGLESRVAASLMSSLKGYYDPAWGIRAGCLVRETLATNDVEMILGSGVFVPRPGERPVGWLRYYPDARDRAHFIEPALPDGRPAGIYKGQAGLAFGAGAGRFPADLDLGLADETSLFFSLSKAVEGDQDRGFKVELGVAGERSVRPVPQPADDVPPDVDSAWRIIFSGVSQPPGHFELCADGRRSRLHHTRTPRCNTAIEKIRIDLGAFSGGVDRFWIDFDHRNRLAASALQHVQTSLVWDNLDRRDYAYGWTGSSSPFRAAGRIGMIVKSVDGAVEIARADEQALGYLELPEHPQQAIFADEFQTLDGFHLDWLDECGRISISDRVVPLGQAYAEIGGETRVAAAGRKSPGGRQVVGPLVLADLTDST